jgi:Na+-translocating ferredoxin:NAD+ oxidoreductase RnfD subunit
MQMFSLSAYILFADFGLTLRRFNMQDWMIALAAGLATEAMMAKFSSKPIRLSSAYISSSAIFFLLDSPYWWADPALAAIAVFLKRNITDFRGSHHFNPANLALLCGIGVTPMIYTLDPTRLPHRQDLYLLIVALGSLTVVLAKRYWLAASYLGSFVILSALWATWTGENLSYSIFRVLGPLNLVFCFHMISDPVTSPEKRNDQLRLGVALACVDVILRELYIYHSTLLAMISIAALRGTWTNWRFTLHPLECGHPVELKGPQGRI